MFFDGKLLYNFSNVDKAEAGGNYLPSFRALSKLHIQTQEELKASNFQRSLLQLQVQELTTLKEGMEKAMEAKEKEMVTRDGVLACVQVGVCIMVGYQLINFYPDMFSITGVFPPTSSTPNAAAKSRNSLVSSASGEGMTIESPSLIQTSLISILGLLLLYSIIVTQVGLSSLFSNNLTSLLSYLGLSGEESDKDGSGDSDITLKYSKPRRRHSISNTDGMDLEYTQVFAKDQQFRRKRFESNDSIEVGSDDYSDEFSDREGEEDDGEELLAETLLDIGGGEMHDEYADSDDEDEETIMNHGDSDNDDNEEEEESVINTGINMSLDSYQDDLGATVTPHSIDDDNNMQGNTNTNAYDVSALSTLQYLEDTLHLPAQTSWPHPELLIRYGSCLLLPLLLFHEDCA